MIQVALQQTIRLVPWRVRGRIKDLPLMASLQRYLVRRFLDGREFVHLIDAGPGRGLRVPVCLPEDKGLWTGTYEFALAAAVATSVRPGSTGFDVQVAWESSCTASFSLNDAGARSSRFL